MVLLSSLIGTVGVMLVGTITWAAQLHSKVNVTAQKQEDYMLQVRQQHEDLKELIQLRADAIDVRLQRIERKVLNGSYLE